MLRKRAQRKEGVNDVGCEILFAAGPEGSHRYDFRWGSFPENMITTKKNRFLFSRAVVYHYNEYPDYKNSNGKMSYETHRTRAGGKT